MAKKKTSDQDFASRMKKLRKKNKVELESISSATKSVIKSVETGNNNIPATAKSASG